MIYVLAIVLAALMGMVLISLLRGLNAFRTSLDAGDVETASGATELQVMQNKMMWARVKYQGLAVIVVMILLGVAR
jgi:hypothetical protein